MAENKVPFSSLGEDLARGQIQVGKNKVKVNTAAPKPAMTTPTRSISKSNGVGEEKQRDSISPIVSTPPPSQASNRARAQSSHEVAHVLSKPLDFNTPPSSKARPKIPSTPSSSPGRFESSEKNSTAGSHETPCSSPAASTLGPLDNSPGRNDEFDDVVEHGKVAQDNTVQETRMDLRRAMGGANSDAHVSVAPSCHGSRLEISTQQLTNNGTGTRQVADLAATKKYKSDDATVNEEDILKTQDPMTTSEREVCAVSEPVGKPNACAKDDKPKTPTTTQGSNQAAPTNDSSSSVNSGTKSIESNSEDFPPPPPPVASKPAFFVGQVVSVASRTWPGINKPGGMARITKIHAPKPGFKYNVVYILGGSERNVDEVYIETTSFDSKGRAPKQRDFFADYVPIGNVSASTLRPRNENSDTVSESNSTRSTRKKGSSPNHSHESKNTKSGGASKKEQKHMKRQCLKQQQQQQHQSRSEKQHHEEKASTSSSAQNISREKADQTEGSHLKSNNPGQRKSAPEKENQRPSMKLKLKIKSRKEINDHAIHDKSQSTHAQVSSKMLKEKTSKKRSSSSVESDRKKSKKAKKLEQSEKLSSNSNAKGSSIASRPVPSFQEELLSEQDVQSKVIDWLKEDEISCLVELEHMFGEPNTTKKNPECLVFQLIRTQAVERRKAANRFLLDYRRLQRNFGNQVKRVAVGTNESEPRSTLPVSKFSSLCTSAKHGWKPLTVRVAHHGVSLPDPQQHRTLCSQINKIWNQLMVTHNAESHALHSQHTADLWTLARSHKEQFEISGIWSKLDGISEVIPRLIPDFEINFAADIQRGGDS